MPVGAAPTSVQVLGPTALPILHLHLLRRCNLACRHCYSSSGPSESEELPLGQALLAVDLAAAWGYGHVAISGGEPLLYRHLGAVLDYVHRLGLEASLVTNGLRAGRPEALELLQQSRNVTVSLDGAAPRHDGMRQREGAFEAALGGLEALSRAGIECGVAYGVTKDNVEDLETVLQIARDAGATYAHVHAVEAAGRAATGLNHSLLDRDDVRRVFVLARLLALQSDRGAVSVHCDLVHRDRVLERPALVYASGHGAHPLPHAELRPSVLVVEPDGAIVPVCYGFDRAFQIGTIRDVVDGDNRTLQQALRHAMAELRKVGDSLLHALQDDPEWTVLNPSEALGRHANTMKDVAARRVQA